MRLSTMNNFFCGLHVLVGLSEQANKTLAVWEDLVQNGTTPGRQNEPSQRQAAPLWGRRRLSEGATSRLGVNVEQVNMFVLEICIFCYFAPIIWL